ncbi:class I SAM-dependent DNA methyltransferase [Rhodovulum sp. DZ06]|uniref:class I SAM-dependent DNA methyltransferase n=1 Tax=Rhodovulum sp. DZ06 TaxID=3425126 RepID=UPI003D356F5D
MDRTENDEFDDDDAPGGEAEERIGALYSQALAQEKSGDTDAAAASWEALLALDPEDRVGAAMRLAALGRAEAPGRAPDAYVALLFDQHAAAFEDILAGKLGYRAPELARAAVEAAAPGYRDKMLDLGCGTGLAARAFDDMVGRITGVDLSEGMLEEADAAELYDALYLGEAVSFLQAEATEGEEDEDAEFDSPWDLVVATDVLPYLGDPAPLFAACARHAVPGGLLVFTTETLPEEAFGGKDWVVGAHHRYHHRGAGVAAALEAAGWTPLSMEIITVRTNEGRPEPGHLVVARKAG